MRTAAEPPLPSGADGVRPSRSDAVAPPRGDATYSSFDVRFLHVLHAAIRIAVRILAVLMVVVIVFGVLDAGYVLYKRILQHPIGLMSISDILVTFGAFMAVLIAIEIFQNIVIYLRSDVIHLRLVLVTALMAAARKVIVLDFKEMSPAYVYGLAAIVLAIGAVYWLVAFRPGRARTAEVGAEDGGVDSDEPAGIGSRGGGGRDVAASHP
jgi:uncharacterized membrane protein (DUF373 family)